MVQAVNVVPGQWFRLHHSGMPFTEDALASYLHSTGDYIVVSLALSISGFTHFNADPLSYRLVVMYV
jgi:hypothetical protein